MLGVSFRGDKAFFMLVCVTFALCGIGVLALRRGAFGRRLVAMRESPAACATLGLNLTATKLIVFSLSSAMAGLAGAFYGGLRGQVGLNDFEMLQSLVLLLLVSVAGINTVTRRADGRSHLRAVPEDPAGAAEHPEPLVPRRGFRCHRPRAQPQRLDAAISSRTSTRRAPPSPVDRNRIHRPRPRSTSTVPLRARRWSVLEVEDIDVKFGVLAALSEVTLGAAAGQVTGLIGPNGAGKTTLFNVITGLQTPSVGKVFIDGEDVTKLKPHVRARRHVARTFQRLEVFGSLTARENILVGAEIRNGWIRPPRTRTRSPTRSSTSSGSRAVADEPVDSMPTGLARLVELGRALAIRPKLLLLDEPGSGLNPEETLALGDLLKDLA